MQVLLGKSKEEMNYILSPVQDITTGLNKYNSVKLIQNKIKDILYYKDLKSSKGMEKFSFEEAIEFRNVSFSYEDNRNILRNISFKIEKGSKTAIVGLSGSGKSTILKLLLRYYDNFDGEILIDGVDVRSIKTIDLYKLCSMIHQNIFLFDGSIKDNITLYDNSYSDEDLHNTVKLSGLQEFIDKLSEKENSYIEENGYTLSGGEKQRIAIARAIIRKTPILFLDEITSSLDNQTAYQIENSLLKIDSLTAIIVTHKLYPKLLKEYDNIVVLKDGKIVEMGTFDNLINLKGYFYSLYSVQ